MNKSHLRIITRRFWAFFLGSIIAFAVLVQIGRQAFLLVNDYRDVVEASFSDQLGVDLRIGSINASWHGLRLQMQLTDVDVFSEEGQEVFKIGFAEAELSLIDSLLQGGMAWRTITFESFKTTFVQSDDHTWKIKGYDGGTANTDNPFVFDDPLDIFLFGRRVEIRSASFLLEFKSGSSSELSIPSISLENDRFFHRVNAELNVDGQNTLNFVVEGYGDPRNKQQFSSNGYLELKSVALSDITNAILDDENAVAAMDYIGEAVLDFQLWFKGSPKTGMTATGAISVDGIAASENKYGLDLPNRIESSIAGLWNTPFGWQFALQKPIFSWKEKELNFADIGFYGQADQSGIRISELSIEDLVSAVVSSGNEHSSGISEALSELQPKGLLQNLDIQLKSEKEGYFLARANVLAGSSEAYMGSPALSNINGYLETSAFNGYVDVNSNTGFGLYLTKVFNENIEMDSARGQVAWRVSLDEKTAYLESSNIYGSQGERQVQGAFALELPFNRTIGEEKLSLVINVDSANVLEYSSYLPKNVPDTLASWLSDSIVSGGAKNISVLYHGSVSREPSIKPSYQVSADFDNFNLQFDKRWPSLEQGRGHFLLDSNNVSAVLRSGRSLGNTLSMAIVNTVDMFEGRGLSINVDLAGETNKAKEYLLASPVKSATQTFLPDWELRGAYRANVQLDIPFSFKEEEIDYQISADLTENSIYLQPIKLKLEEVSGQLQYSREHGFQTDEMEFSLWGKRFASSANSENAHQDIVFDLSGQLNTKEFKSWAKRPEFVFIDGDTKINGQLKVPTSTTSDLPGLELNLTSELEGLELDLPAPFYKARTSSMDAPAKVVIRHTSDETYYKYLHGEAFSVNVFSKNESLPYVELNVGSALKKAGTEYFMGSDNVEGYQPGVVQILGSLDSASYEEWSLSIDRFARASEKLSDEAESEAGVHIKTNLLLGEFDIFGVLIPNLSVLAENREDFSWLIQADSEMLKGQLELPSNESPIDIDLEFLSIQFDEEGLGDKHHEELLGNVAREVIVRDSEDGFLSENSDLEADKNTVTDTISVAQVSAFSDFDLSAIEPVDVNIENLNIDGADWGAWSFLAQPIENGLRFDNLKAKVRKLRIGHSIDSQFYWTKHDDEHLSRFVGSIDTDDIGAALEAWDFERIMQSESAHFDMDISWAAEPDLISLPLLQGPVGLNIENGSFLRGAEAGENPLLRLVALFNFDSLARRLRLDFSDLASKGFAYDSVKSELLFDEGVAFIREPLLVESSSSKMRMEGALNLIDEEVDAELVVTLPVAGNLAVATAFAAGLPAGLGVYIISKMFDKHVDKVSSISYSVDGAWDDPKVKVRKVFDNKTHKKESSTSKEGAENTVLQAADSAEVQVSDPFVSGDSVSDVTDLTEPNKTEH